MRNQNEHFYIKESVKKLETILQNCSRNDQSKLQFLLILKQEKNISYSEVSEILKVGFKKLMEWEKLYERGGINLLLEKEILEDDTNEQETESFDPIQDTETKNEMPEAQHINGIHPTTDVNELMKWIAENYITKKEFVGAINDLKKKSALSQETLNVLRRMIKLLNA